MKEENTPKKLRQRVLAAMIATDTHKERLITPLYTGSYKITELKNLDTEKLTHLYLENIPHDTQYTKAFVIDLELKESFFAKPNPEGLSIKTVEKALVFFTASSIYILLIEMKQQLKQFGEEGLKKITQKIRDSISRTDIILSYFVPDFNEEVKKCEVVYHALICYNHEVITKESKSMDKDLLRLEIYKVFLGKKDLIQVKNEFDLMYRVPVFFEKNTHSEPTTMYIDLNILFQDDYDFQYWKESKNLIFPF